MITGFLFKRIDNSQIIVWRIFFGLLVAIECWGAIATGWVKETFVEPSFTFSFIGFEWTHFLLGPTMYYVYGFLGFLGILIAIGAFYKISSFLFAVSWSLVYFMQKEHYNNHYYLLMLVSWFMVFIPSNRLKSVDVLIWPQLRSNVTYNWTRLIFIFQLFIVYIYAAVAKLYQGWWSGDFLKGQYRNLGRWVQENIEWQTLTDFVYSREFAKLLSVIGFWFDLLIIPLLMWKRTRIAALIAAVFFHLFNSVTLHIGIFPFFALAMSVFFFPPKTIHRLFLDRRAAYLPDSYEFKPRFTNHSLFAVVFFLYFGWQIYLPLRHWLIPGDVLWTEEGHRLSWRMMLRDRTATIVFKVKDKKTATEYKVNLSEEMTPLQLSRISTHPDMIWQFAQRLKQEYAAKGKDVSVFVNSQVSVNGGPFYEFTDSNADLAAAKWKYFGHQDWMLNPPDDFYNPVVDKESLK